MVIDGRYDIEVSMPEGKRTLHIILDSEGKTLSGSVDGPFGKHSFSEGSIDNNEVSWTVILEHHPVVTKPVSEEKQEKGFFRKLRKLFGEAFSAPPMGTLPASESEKSKTELLIEFKAAITGDDISGKMKFGPYATGDFKGIRTGK